MMIPPIKVITETVECLRTLAAIVLAIVPKWETHIWYSTLRERATHSFVNTIAASVLKHSKRPRFGIWL